MLTRPIGQEQDKESLMRRCLPKTALGAGKLACTVSALAMLIGVALLVTASVLNHEQAASQGNGSLAEARENIDYQSLNQEWIRLRDTLLPTGTMVLPHSPQARALMWLALLNSDEQVRPLENASPLPLSERYALAVLYYHWAGWSWRLPEEEGDAAVRGWDLTWVAKDLKGSLIRSKECEWYGVACAETVTGGMTVTKLNMTGGSYFSLRGTIPSELGILSNMEDFAVANNQLYGSIPTELKSWTNLRSLSLRFNLLTGLGDAYGSWTAIEFLDIGENRFSGNISSQALRLMNNIKTLSLINNRELHADEPLFIEPSNGPFWPALQEISIAITQIELDLSHVTGENFPSITKIDAAQAPLKGFIPPSIGTLSKLDLLNLMNPVRGQITGSIPTEIGLLSDNLTFLSLDAIGISGTLPSEIGYLTSIETFSVYMNSLSGTIPTEVGNMQALEFFSVANNGLSGTVPSQLGLCTKLMHMEFHYTQLTGTIPQEICSLDEHIEEGFLKITASCAITPETATARQVVCTCCTDCYGS